MTISHLRFGASLSAPVISSPTPASSPATSSLSWSASTCCDVAEPGATFLLNSPFGPAEVWDHLPRTVQQQIIEKKLRFYVIDACRVAKENGMGGRINTVMQTCFFALSGALPREEAIAAIKHAIEKTYGKRGEAVVEKTTPRSTARWRISIEVKVPASGDQRNLDGGRRARPELRFRAQRAGADDAGRGRQLAGQRPAHRRHLSNRHGQMGKAKSGARNPGLGRGTLYPVRQMRDGLPARGDSRQSRASRN